MTKEKQLTPKQHPLSEIKGLGPATITKLAEINITTVKGFARATRRVLEEVGIKEGARKLQQQAFDLTGQKLFMTAAELAEEHKNLKRLSTGSTKLDKLFGGGYETSSITEIVGEFGCGKTQLAFTAAIMVQLPEDCGGLNGNALIIDTEGSFSETRIIEIAKSRGLDPATTLENIFVARAFNSDHQDLIMSKADEIMQEKNVRLLIIDSLIAHFRSEYLRRENLSERQQELNHHLSRISGLASDYSAVAIFTNQMIATPDGFHPYGPQMKPAGGNIIAHKAQLRISLRKGKPPIRIARVLDSSCLPDAECPFQLNERGIDDIGEEKAKENPANVQ